MTKVYITTEELSDLIGYDIRTIRERLKDSILFEGVHYISLFGGKKVLYDSEAVKRDLCMFSANVMDIPLLSGTIAYD
jgi:hypothetical protein